ncbi:hypothetical protein BJX70DRAFT_390750 [Aspergillus crustosus]
MLRATTRLSLRSYLNLRTNGVSPRYSSSTPDNSDIKSMLAKPTWSVSSLLPDPAAKPSSPSVTPAQLRHLLRLSALPQPSSPEEEQRMLETLEAQIHFVKEIQKVDTTGVKPLQSIRDESPKAVKENTIGLERLEEALAKERVVGRNKKIRRDNSPKNDRPDGDIWDGNALGHASETKGKFFAESKTDQDLTTILSRPQRGDLTVLIAEITQRMRDSVDETFNSATAQHSHSAETKHLIDLDSEDDAPKPDAKKPEKLNDKQARIEYKPTAEDAKAEANLLTNFDDWRDSVLLRVGEAVNQKQEDQEEETDSQDNERPESPHEDEDDHSWSRLAEVYSPVETPLIRLPKPKRLLVLHSLLLLMLSLEHYSANSRVLMLYTASSLGLGIKTLNQDEVKVSRGLLDAALQLSANSDAQSETRESDPSRKWKVGIASVAGAVLIGVTGGLAAPFIAAGLGTVMGGLGLGATAAAGYLGALAGSGVIVGGLFGAYGGRMTGRMVDKYAREVDDFAFLPIHGSRHRSDDEKEAAKEDHRLRVTIGITGWLTEEENFVVPWRVIGRDSEVFGLRWETKNLLDLGNAIDYLVTTAAWSAGRHVLSKTILGGIMSAMVLPLGLLKVATVADNPFSVAKARSDKAGEVLADALISKVQGERPVTLIGYSLGSRVIYACLQSLAQRHAYGLVESAIFLGSPTPSDAPDWRRLRRVVSGRLVNVYSENDSVLAFLYRTSSLQLGVAGLEPIENVPGVENYNASDLIDGHLRYQFLIGRILRRVGLEAISSRELARGEAALAAKDRRQQQQRIQNERRAGIEGDKGEDKPAPQQEKPRATRIARRPVPGNSTEETATREPALGTSGEEEKESPLEKSGEEKKDPAPTNN